MNPLRDQERRRTRRGARLGVTVASMLLVGAVAELGSAPPASAAASIVMTGGAGNAETVCGNVASAQNLALRRRVRLQRMNCTARADGGTVTLDNVNIFVSASQASQAIARLTQNRDRQTRSICDPRRRAPGRGFQLNICSGTARGGAIVLNNVRRVTRTSDGRITSSRDIHTNSGPARIFPDISASCGRVSSAGAEQRDDCYGSGDGSSWDLRGVDIERNGTMSRGIDIVLRGGDANAVVRCMNTTDGSGRVVQINRCNSMAQGGAIVLNNVTFTVVQ